MGLPCQNASMVGGTGATAVPPRKYLSRHGGFCAAATFPAGARQALPKVGHLARSFSRAAPCPPPLAVESGAVSSDLAIHLIPNRSLDQFLYLPVLVGMLVVFAFTEVYGWVFVGLVVPGYLATVFVMQPAAGVTIVFEGLVTLGLARLVSDGLSRTGVWTTLFGRDRFFFIICLSVLVRQQVEIVMLPAISNLVASTTGWELHLEKSFFSVALVLVPLIANSFWNLTFRRGAIQLSVSVGVTWLVLKWIFLPLAILSLSRLELVYLDYEVSFSALAKAYLLLLLGAGMSSRQNHLYGWDFNGIVVPALLAICWLEPMRLASTVAEAMLLVVVTRWLLARPMLQTRNLEGPRKAVIVYCMSVALKLLAARLLAEPFLGFGFGDLFGFGHLLPTLLALKMLERGEMRPVLLPTLQTSLVAFVLGSGIGFMLDQALPIPPKPVVAVVMPVAPTRTLSQSADATIALGSARARSHESDPPDIAPGGEELARYAALWREIDGWLDAGVAAPPEGIAASAKALGLVFAKIPDGKNAFALTEQTETLSLERGFDTAVFFPGAKGPILELPRPASERDAAAAATALCETLGCRAILAAGVDVAGSAGSSPFTAAHRALGRSAVVDLRSDPALAGTGARVYRTAVDTAGALWPGAIDVALGETPALFAPDATGPATSVVRVSPADLRALRRARTRMPATRAGTLAEWLARQIDPRGARYLPASESELRFLDTFAVSGLARAAALPAGAERDDALRDAAADAALCGLSVEVLPACGSAGCALLAETASPARLGWGALAIALGASGAPVVIEVPRPTLERDTGRAGAELFRTAHAQALLVAGPAETAGLDVDPDPARSDNSRTPFQAMHQALTRRLFAETALVAQVRELGDRMQEASDVVVGLGDPLLEPARVPAPVSRLFVDGAPLGWLRDRMRIADGSAGDVGLGGGASPQHQYSRGVGGAPVATLWFSRRVLDSLAGDEWMRHERWTETAGLALSGSSAARALLEDPLDAPGAPPAPSLLRRFENSVERRVIRAGWSLDLGAPFVIVETREGNDVLREVLVGAGTGRRTKLEAGDAALPRKISEALRPDAAVILHGVARSVKGSPR